MHICLQCIMHVQMSQCLIYVCLLSAIFLVLYHKPGDALRGKQHQFKTEVYNIVVMKSNINRFTIVHVHPRTPSGC